MRETKPAIIQVRPGGVGRPRVTRLEVADIGYGFCNGPTGSSASLIFCDDEGKMLFHLSMDEEQLDPDVAHSIYLAATNQKRS